MRVVSVYPNFANQGGAQDVALQLAEHLNKGVKPIVLVETPLSDIVPAYSSRAEFLPFSWHNVRKLADGNTLFLSHHRKNTSLLLLFGGMMCKKLPLIHVAHNTFTSLKWLSYFPETIIAVSNAVKANLIEYFEVPENRVQVVFNGMKDVRNDKVSKLHPHEIHILLPGRICPVKQQVEMVKALRGKLAHHIHIFFAGMGEDVEILKEEIAGDAQFHYVGFLKMDEHLNEYDYVCLFSKNEGLPLSLIEGLMFGKPLITNNLPAVLDVNKSGETGFVFTDFKALAKGLNELPMPDSEEYQRLSYSTRLRYEHFFTEENMIMQYKRLIEKGIGQITPPNKLIFINLNTCRYAA